MDITTNAKGQLAVTKAELRSLEKGFLPSRPLFDSRYDLIIDTGTDLLRAQVKYAGANPNKSSGSVVVKLEYENRKKRVYTYNDNEVDVLLVYIPIIDKLCMIPKSIFINKRKIHLRILKSKNNQKKRVIDANDFYW